VNYEDVGKALQENLILLAQIDRQQDGSFRGHNKLLAECAVFQRRTEQNLAEIRNKLNGLIGYIDGMRPPEKN
jgi:hypothetical protein